MTTSTGPGVRRSIQDILDDYSSGKDKTALETLIRAWQGIQQLPADDLNSFFVIGGYHGEPFRGPGMMDASWWGGYCQHGTVLFPIWHRAYLHRLEKALQSIPGCESVMLPFWVQASGAARAATAPPLVEVEVRTHQGLFGNGPQRPIQPVAEALAAQTAPYSVEIR